jgi:hypothetical protein
MFKPFLVRLGVDTPVALNNLLHLDGLLGKVLYDQGKTLDDLPLECFEGVWMGSAAILETGAFGAGEETITRIRTIREENIPSALLAKLSGQETGIGPMSPYRNRLRAYPLASGVNAVWFAGLGDAKAVMALLEHVNQLGAMYKTGYGRVISREIFACGNARAGLAILSTLDAGELLPARAVPLAVWDKVTGLRPARAVIAERRAVPPYYQGDPVRCISPIQADLTGTRRDIMRRLEAA